MTIVNCVPEGIFRRNTDPARADREHALAVSSRCYLAGHLVLQRKRADCWITSPIIAALCHVGGQNANRQSQHERGGDSDYAFGHHGSPLSF
jgi:hypothetical protein